MRTRAIPGTGLQLSVVGFGCWAIGGKWWGPVDDTASKRAVARAVDLGINWFDTAPLYGYGHADEILREGLGRRIDDVIVATKVGPRWDTGDEHAVSDLSPENIRRDVDASLARLGIDCIPLLQAHWPCERRTPLEATLETFEELRVAGKIRHYGLCNHEAADMAKALSLSAACTLQAPYSMVRREIEREILPMAEAGDEPAFALLVYETLCRGLLTGKFDEQPVFPESDMRLRDDRFRGSGFQTISHLVAALRIVARRLDVPPAAVATAWTLQRPGVTAAIVGAKTAEQVDENVLAAEGLAERRKLWDALEPHVDACRV